MEFHHLRYFCAVARAGTFTKAAEDENVSQPSLSEGVRKLEEELGVSLFSRLGRGTRLTRSGEEFLPHAEQILRNISEARRSVEAAHASSYAGRLTIGCIPTILPYLLAPNLSGFTESYPEVELTLVEDLTVRLIERLQRGEIDLAIVGLPVRNPDLICSELVQEPLFLAVPKTNRLAAQSQVDLTEIVNERLLLLKEGHCFRSDVMGVCRKAKVIARSQFESDHLDSIFALVAAGFGVAIVPAMAVPSASNCVLLPIVPSGERRVGYVKLKLHRVSPAEKVFLSWMRTVAKQVHGARAVSGGVCQL